MNILNIILTSIAAITGIGSLSLQIRNNLQSFNSIIKYINNSTIYERNNLKRKEKENHIVLGDLKEFKSLSRILIRYKKILEGMKLKKDILTKPKIVKMIENRIKEINAYRDEVNKIMEYYEKEYDEITEKLREIIPNKVEKMEVLRSFQKLSEGLAEYEHEVKEIAVYQDEVNNIIESYKKKYDEITKNHQNVTKNF
ncbi:hypothetical protein BUY91_07745 [Staphylococcus equorum]|uniref:hypothetical protein n=1 Tax=Staphylococcus equorum TaxID=246432 RepID=UPI000D1D1127|nr:hypothetical protein [Staphylococcus equorum]PTE27615.1 hypothetical protein BUY91_07745 [Staphylococcus equorum]